MFLWVVTGLSGDLVTTLWIGQPPETGSAPLPIQPPCRDPGGCPIRGLGDVRGWLHRCCSATLLRMQNGAAIAGRAVDRRWRVVSVPSRRCRTVVAGIQVVPASSTSGCQSVRLSTASSTIGASSMMPCVNCGRRVIDPGQRRNTVVVEGVDSSRAADSSGWSITLVATLCTSSIAGTGTWSSNASNAAVAAPLVQTLPAGSPTRLSAPVRRRSHRQRLRDDRNQVR